MSSREEYKAKVLFLIQNEPNMSSNLQGVLTRIFQDLEATSAQVVENEQNIKDILKLLKDKGILEGV